MQALPMNSDDPKIRRFGFSCRGTMTCPSAIRSGEVSVFMEHAYRKFRKYGSLAIIATQ